MTLHPEFLSLLCSLIKKLDT